MKKMLIKTFFLLILIFGLTEEDFGQSWLGKFIPMETNIKAIEEAFDAKPEKRIDSFLYKLTEGNLLVYYSLNNCSDTVLGRFNVEQGTVINFIFYPKIQRRLSYYKVDVGRMKKSSDDTDAKIYFDDEKGVSYSAYARRVHSIEYYPAKKYDFLKCQE